MRGCPLTPSSTVPTPHRLSREVRACQPERCNAVLFWHSAERSRPHQPSTLPVLDDCGQVQSCDFHCASVIKKYENTSSFRMDCRVIGCWNSVFAAITCSNGERL